MVSNGRKVGLVGKGSGLIVGCFLLLAAGIGLTWAYPLGAYEQPNSWRACGWLVGLLIVSGMAYAGSVYGVLRGDAGGARSLIWILAVGIGLRLVTSLSPAAFEDDFYRYLWDGGVTAHGLNPYRYAPETVSGFSDEDPQPGETLARLRDDAGETFDRINHPHLKTIYPPLTQAAFALGFQLAPWRLAGWRMVLALADIAVVILILMNLRLLQRPSAWVMLYWWNPLAIKEIYNSGHMDVLTLVFLMAAVWAHLRTKPLSAIGLLALATATKFWPVMLLPLFCRPILLRPSRWLPALLLFGAVLAASLAPIVMAGVGDDSGFGRYMTRWEMNDGLYMVFLWIVRALMPNGVSADASHLITRLLTVGLLAVGIGFSIRRAPSSGREFCERCLLTLAAVFLLSPTQFPWYALWFLAFLPLAPRWSLVWLTVLLPLYYLRFAFDAAGLVRWFDCGVVWIEFAPVLALLLWEWWSRGRAVAGACDPPEPITG
ncbi:MAG: hypothetical protein O3A51_06535 [Verrucomicrobia bacterium]|nr:hypothetical protein [Verrucomicrobiota bacterium]